MFEPFFKKKRGHILERIYKNSVDSTYFHVFNSDWKALNKFVEVRTNSPLRISERREATMVRLLQNIFSYAIYFVAGVMILETLSVDVRGLLAGAGIVGLSRVWCSKLSERHYHGIFIIFEDQFSVGDYVRVGTFEGTVEEIGCAPRRLRVGQAKLIFCLMAVLWRSLIFRYITA